MKKINVIITVLIFSLFISCKKDILTENPKTLVVEDFYNTNGQVEAALASIYTPIRGPLAGWMIGAIECQTEWGAGIVGATNFDGHKTMQGLDAVPANNIVQIWDNLFLGVRNANLVIKNAPNGKELTTDAKSKYIGEAKFMRAFIYLQLVKSWGGVPLYTELNMDKTSGVAKSTKDEVYKLIVSDLKFAETNLPDNAPLLGKPSKLIAKAVLADVYLYMGMYSDASQKADEVIKTQRYSLEKVTVADDFNKLFGIGASSAEEVFYLKFNTQNPSGLILFTQQITTPWFGTSGYGIFTWFKESKYFSEWDDKDLRKRFNWYEDPKAANRYVAGQTAFPQKGVTLISPKKYNNPTATIAAFDLPVYRYADILLIYAEAEARANKAPTANAVEKLNMVHRRAYGYDPMLASPVDFKLSDYNETSFIDLVVKERGYEFQFEGKRWFDLVRSGRVNSVIKTYIDRDVAAKHLLWPIPAIEFSLNEALKPADQNPGY
ncbi:MAG: RagB/SusD family nutrient uptake outer membrane protein [Bacteroidota bacterium]